MAVRLDVVLAVVAVWFEVRNCELVTLEETVTERISIIIPVLNIAISQNRL
jgi:hypothetical protein